MVEITIGPADSISVLNLTKNNENFPEPANATLDEQYSQYTEPEILALLALGAFGFILNIATISIASRRPVFVHVPIKPLVVSLGSANLFTVSFCMVLNAAWHSFGQSLFGSDCRLFKTLEAFSLGATAYVVVVCALDRCRSVNLGTVEKDGLELPVQKSRHLSKLVLGAWVLSVLLALQHVIVLPSEDGAGDLANRTVERLPAIMDCVSRGRFYPPWKQIVVDVVSISTVYLIPVTFIVGCLAALFVNFIRRTRQKATRPSLPMQRFRSYDELGFCDDDFIGCFVAVISLLFIFLWGPYYTLLLIKITGLLDVFASLSSTLYLVGLGYALVTPVVYLIFHLVKMATDKESIGLDRTPSTVRERIEMLQRNQLSRRFDDL